MKNKTTILISLIVLTAFLLTGCATCSSDLGTFFGMGVKDLEKAKADGKSKTFPLSYDTAFSKVTEILKSNKLAIYQSNRKKGYIVAMGFHKQTNTTRVGIFFASIAENETQITLSSLSDTALAKGTAIIFGELEK
jgi:starvation-inducible outer membrane lipoprotein